MRSAAMGAKEVLLEQVWQICANKKWGKARFGRDKRQSFHIGKVTLAAPGGKRDHGDEEVEIEDLDER